jgi:hypothetical protein
MRFPVVQCLCGPKRHAILAAAVNTTGEPLANDGVDTIAALKAAVSLMLEARGAEVSDTMPASIDPWCGLCGAPASAWTYEIAWTREFPDFDAALRVLKASEADQRHTAALLDLLDVSYNARMRGEVARQVDAAHRRP